MESLHGEFQKRGLILAQAVPFDNPDWNYKAYADVTDYLMLMAYDQHWSNGRAGRDCRTRLVRGEFEKTNGGTYRRRKLLFVSAITVTTGQRARKKPKIVTFQEAVLTARESLDSPEE